MTRPYRPAKVREKVDTVLPVLPPIVPLDEPVEEDLSRLLPIVVDPSMLPETVTPGMLPQVATPGMLPVTASMLPLAPGMLPTASNALLPSVTSTLLPNLRWGTGGAMQGMGRAVTHHVVRRRILVLPPDKPPTPKVWWLPAYEYEDMFDWGWTDKCWRVRSIVDFDDAVQRMVARSKGKIRLGEDLRGSVDPVGMRAYLLADIEHTFEGYNDDRATGHRDEWNEVTAAYLMIRENLARWPDLIERIDLDSADGRAHRTEIAEWAGVLEPGKLRAADIVAAARADTMEGLGAAAIDYLAWVKPEAVADTFGQQLLSAMAYIRNMPPKELVPEAPLDNFLFRQGTWFDHELVEKWQGSPQMLLRGGYVVQKAHYVSLAAKVDKWKLKGKRPPHGLPGWRTLELVPTDDPRHICGADCYAGEGCGCGRGVITTLWGPDKRNLHGCCEPDCERGNRDGLIDAIDLSGYGCAC